MSLETLHKAQDLVHLAAREGSLAIYVESDLNGKLRLIFPDGDYGLMAETLYAAADSMAEQRVNPTCVRVTKLRD